MKLITSLLVLAVLLSAGCARKKAEPQADADNPHAGMDMSNNPHAGMDMKNPHAGMEMNGGPGALDLEAMMAGLPEGWSKSEPTSSMRVAQIAIAPVKGDAAAEIAIFHFPGSGGSAAANIERWQNQYTGPKGQPGSEVARTDTAMVNLLTVITTDVSGTQLAQGAMMGSAATKDLPNYRMIASVIETPSGNWFIKAVGPQKTIAANEAKIRGFIKRAKVKEGSASGHGPGDGHGH